MRSRTQSQASLVFTRTRASMHQNARAAKQVLPALSSKLSCLLPQSPRLPAVCPPSPAPPFALCDSPVSSHSSPLSPDATPAPFNLVCCMLAHSKAIGYWCRVAQWEPLRPPSSRCRSCTPGSSWLRCAPPPRPLSHSSTCMLALVMPCGFPGLCIPTASMLTLCLVNLQKPR